MSVMTLKGTKTDSLRLEGNRLKTLKNYFKNNKDVDDLKNFRSLDIIINYDVYGFSVYERNENFDIYEKSKKLSENECIYIINNIDDIFKRNKKTLFKNIEKTNFNGNEINWEISIFEDDENGKEYTNLASNIYNINTKEMKINEDIEKIGNVKKIKTIEFDIDVKNYYDNKDIDDDLVITSTTHENIIPKYIATNFISKLNYTDQSLEELKYMYFDTLNYEGFESTLFSVEDQTSLHSLLLTEYLDIMNDVFPNVERESIEIFEKLRLNDQFKEKFSFYINKSIKNFKESMWLNETDEITKIENLTSKIAGQIEKTFFKTIYEIFPELEDKWKIENSKGYDSVLNGLKIEHKSQIRIVGEPSIKNSGFMGADHSNKVTPHLLFKIDIDKYGNFKGLFLCYYDIENNNKYKYVESKKSSVTNLKFSNDEQEKIYTIFGDLIKKKTYLYEESLKF